MAAGSWLVAMALLLPSFSQTLLAFFICAQKSYSLSLLKLSVTLTQTFSWWFWPLSASQKLVKVWWPSVRYSVPFGPMTTVFMSAGLLPTADLHWKLAGGLDRVAPATLAVLVSTSLWPFASHRSANFFGLLVLAMARSSAP